MTLNAAQSHTIPEEEVITWKAAILEHGFPCGDNERYALDLPAAIAELASHTGPVSDNYAIADRVAQATTPATLTDGLSGFDCPGGPDAAILDFGPHSVEIDPTRDMPVGGRRNSNKLFGIDEVILLAVMRAAGYSPLAVINEARLDLFMPVSPDPRFVHTTTALGSIPLGMHVDNAGLPAAYRPDALALQGLVSTERVDTAFAQIDDVLAELRKLGSEFEAILRAPLFRHYTPGSFSRGGAKPYLSDPLPMIEDRDDGRPGFHLHQDRLVADRSDPAVGAALGALDRVLSDGKVLQRAYVAPGKVLLLSNTRTLHGRGEVRGQRYLARLYGKRQLSAFRALASGGDSVYRFRFLMSSADIAATCHKQKTTAI